MTTKISIVMAYHNRLKLLQNTLNSISTSVMSDQIEIIIVDDASDRGNQASLVDTRGLLVKFVYIDKKDKVGHNPCVVFNRGFELANSEIIIIQNPECYHSGDILSHIIKTLTTENYLSYSCWYLPKTITNYTVDFRKLQGWWFNHPFKGNEQNAYHWLSAITKTNLDMLGGFDERYKYGFCFDDNEFITRVRRMGLEVEIVSDEEVYCVHQFHSRFRRAGSNKLLLLNKDLYENVTLKEKGFKVNA